MIRIFRQFLHKIDDGANPLVVMEFRRASRNGSLALFTIFYLLGFTGLSYWFFTHLDDEMSGVFFAFWASILTGILTGVATMQEGIVSVEYRQYDEILDLNGLTDLERFHGRLQIGLFWALYFAVLSIPFPVAAGMFDPRCFWCLLVPPVIIPVIFVLRLLAYGFYTPLRKKREQGVQVLSCVFMFFLAYCVLGGVVFIDGHFFDFGSTPGGFLLPFALFFGLSVLVFTVLAYRLTCRNLLSPKKLILSVVLSNMLYYLGGMLFLAMGWFVCRWIFQ